MFFSNPLILLTQRFQAVQIPSSLGGAGKIVFPDQPNLHGAYITSIILIPPTVQTNSLQSGSSPVALNADLIQTTITLVEGSVEVIKDYPLLGLNPFNDAGNNASQNLKELLKDKKLDWNKCYISLWGNPSANPMYYNLGVYYYYDSDAADGLQRVQAPK
jgi:hypothetical protein